MERVHVTNQFEPDEELKEHVLDFTQEMSKRFNKIKGSFATDIDARFSIIRTRETAIGNMIADLMRSNIKETDIYLSNCGLMRADATYTKGPFKL